MEERDYRNMKVSLLAVLYAVNDLLRRTKNQSLLANMMATAVDMVESMQRDVVTLRNQVTNLEIDNQYLKEHKLNPTMELLNSENAALLDGNAHLIELNRTQSEFIAHMKLMEEFAEWRASKK